MQATQTIPQGASRWPAVALLLLAAMQLTLVWTRAINWDEYSYFREVAYFANGELSRPLQTVHVRLFAWLPGLFGTSTDHIVFARLFMFGCELVTLASIVTIARRFGSREAALFVALAYLSAGFVLQHGTSFRVDPIVTALLSASLAVLTVSRLGAAGIVAFGVLAGLAPLVSIKVVLWLPAFAGIALWRWSERDWAKGELLRLVLAGLGAGLAFALLYTLHATGVTAATGTAASTDKVVGTAISWSFFLGIPPYWQMIVKAALTAPILTAMALAAPFLLWRLDLATPVRLALTGLWLPILSLAFYTNSAAYFFVFILVPVALACTPVMDLAVRRYSPRTLALAFLLIGLAIWAIEDRSTIERQRQLEANVHEVFAEPVAYFDHNYMLGGWPKKNEFLTPWGITSYRQAGRAAYREAMQNHTVPLFLANYPELQEMMSGEDDHFFFAEDAAALRANFIPFSWPIWVAGKDFADRTGSFEEEFLVPGPYTVHGGSLTLDGRTASNGEVVQVDRGIHRVTLGEGQDVKLVWGDHLRPPREPLEPGELYVQF